MRILGFNFKKVEAEKKKDIKGKLNINTNLDIENIEKDKIDLAGDILKFSYIYSVNYEPEFAKIVFKGIVLATVDKPEDIKKILKEWKKKKLPDSLKIPLFNFIISKCNLKALQLEEELALPAHIPLPRLTKKQTQQADYTG